MLALALMLMIHPKHKTEPTPKEYQACLSAKDKNGYFLYGSLWCYVKFHSDEANVYITSDGTASDTDPVYYGYPTSIDWKGTASVYSHAGRVDRLSDDEYNRLQSLQQDVKRAQAAEQTAEDEIAKAHGVKWTYPLGCKSPPSNGFTALAISLTPDPIPESHEFRGQFLLIGVPRASDDVPLTCCGVGEGGPITRYQYPFREDGDDTPSYVIAIGDQDNKPFVIPQPEDEGRSVFSAPPLSPDCAAKDTQGNFFEFRSCHEFSPDDVSVRSSLVGTK